MVHVHEPLTPLLPWLVLHSSKTINIGTFHAYHGHSRIYPWAAPSLRHWFKKLHGRIAVSPLAKMFVEQHFPGDYRVIPNGIDISRYNEGVQPFPEYLDGKINVLFVGTHGEAQGPEAPAHGLQPAKVAVPQPAAAGGGAGHARQGQLPGAG